MDEELFVDVLNQVNFDEHPPSADLRARDLAGARFLVEGGTMDVE